MKLDATMEMAYPRKYLEHIIIGLEYPPNQHLVKLLGFRLPIRATRSFSRRGQNSARQNPAAANEAEQLHRLFTFYYELLYITRSAGLKYRTCAR